MKISTKHRCKWQDFRLEVIKRIDNEVSKFYPGERAFLLGVCNCGLSKAIEYGATEEMKELLELYKERKNVDMAV